MGRPRRVKTIIEQDEDGAAEAVGATEQTQEALRGTEEAAERQPFARILRVDPVDGKAKILTRVQPNLATEDYIQKRYGGGAYIIEFHGQRTDGKFGYLPDKRRTVEIDESIPFKGAAQIAGESAAVPAVREAGDDDTRFLMKTQMMEMMRDQNESRNQNAMMMMTMMKTMTESSSAMLQAITGMIANMKSSQPTGPSLAEIAALVGAMKGDGGGVDTAIKLAQIMKPEGPRESMTDMIRALGEVQELRGLLTGGGEGDGDDDGKWFRLIEKVAPGVLDVLKSESTRTGVPVRQLARGTVKAPVSAPVQIAAPAPASTAAPVTPPVEEPAAVPDEWTPLEPAMRQLLDAAQKGRTPRHVAGFILMMASDEQKAALREIVANDEAADAIISRFPGFATRRVWLEELIDELYAEFFPNAGDGDDAEPEPEPTGEPTA